jgi:hypothetical protein
MNYKERRVYLKLRFIRYRVNEISGRNPVPNDFICDSIIHRRSNWFN